MAKVVNRHYLIETEDIIYGQKNDIVFGCHIGKGMFADVYTIKYKSQKAVLKATNRSKCSKKTFESEMKVSTLLVVSLLFKNFNSIALRHWLSESRSRKCG